MAALEGHVFLTVQTDRAHGLLLDIRQLLLQFLNILHIFIPGSVVHHSGVIGPDVVDGLTGQRSDGGVLDWAGVVLIGGSEPVRESLVTSCPLLPSQNVVNNLPVLVSLGGKLVSMRI